MDPNPERQRGGAPRADASAPGGRDAPDHRYQTHVALLLAAAAIATTLIGARTADLSGAASGSWEKAVRTQVKQSALRTESELFVYGDPVVVVTQYQAAQMRADAYAQALERPELTQDERATLAVFSSAERQVALALHDVALHQSGLIGQQGSHDLADLLAHEQRGARGALAGAEQVRAAGDESSKHAVLEAVAALPAAVAFLLGSAAQARPRSAKALLLAGTALLVASIGAAVALEVVPLP